MNNSNTKGNKPKGPNYLKEEFSPELRRFAGEFAGPMPKNLYGQPPQPSYGQFNVNNPYSQLAQPVYGQPPQPAYGQPPQSFAELVSYPPEPSYEYPPPVPSMQTVPLNSLAGGSTYNGPFGFSNATIPKPPNARRILSDIRPVQVNSPFPPLGGPTTYPGLFSTVNPVTGEIKYYVKGGRKTRARRKRSKTRRH
jgi:hypothetical protein